MVSSLSMSAKRIRIQRLISRGAALSDSRHQRSSGLTTKISSCSNREPISAVHRQHLRLRTVSYSEGLRFYHSTAVTLQASADDDKETGGSSSKDNKPKEEDDEKFTAWLNPLHIDNPEKQKLFPEDFPSPEEMPIQPLPPFDDEDGNIVPPPHIEALAREICNLTMIELNELTDKLAEHHGITEEFMAASYASSPTGAADSAEAAPAEEVVEEKKLFDVKLVGFDAKAKIKVIKEVRAIAGLGLKEAKELVEGAPKVVQKDLKPDKAEELKAQLEAIGAQVEVV